MNEIFSGLRIDNPSVIRVDGVTFSKVCNKAGLEKPYDEKLPKTLVQASELVFEKFNPKLAYLFSDEINFFFLPPLPYDGRVEKIDSIISSIVSASVSLDFGIITAFDSKMIVPEDPIDYLAQRQGEAWRNHLNSYAFYSLIDEGFGRKAASKKLKGMKASGIHEFMFQRGVNLAKTPSWQRRGVLVYKEAYMKEGEDPMRKKKVIVRRKRIAANWDLPIFYTPAGRKFLEGLIYSP